MKLPIKQAFTWVSQNRPIIAFLIPQEEYDRAQKYNGKDLDGYVIDIHKPKRSNEANAYMWHLIHEIALKANLHDTDIYRKAIRDAGVWYDGEVSTKDFADFCEDWSRQGVGWFVEQDIKGTKTTSYRAYRGSSTYNSKQMSRLIDYVVDEAKFWNIETATPEELERLKALW